MSEGPDGAGAGITANRALGTILGGASPPEEKDRATPEQVEERIRATPLPQQWAGQPPQDYGACADYIAHAFLVLADEDPGILTREELYDFPDLDHYFHGLHGKRRGQDSVLYDAAKQKWGAPISDLGITGFQAGWALNTVRYVKGKPTGGNPAIVEMPNAT